MQHRTGRVERDRSLLRLRPQTTGQHGFHPQPQHARKLTSELEPREGGKGPSQQLQRYFLSFNRMPEADKPCRLCLSQLQLSASPLFTGPLGRHRNVLTMPGT